MDILKRSLAPITEEAWDEIDSTARDVLSGLLSARRVVDVEGPMGWDYAAVPLGRLVVPEGTQPDGLEYGLNTVQPLVEVRAHFDLDIWEVDSIIRGAKGINLDNLEDAARRMASFEENAVYKGMSTASITGLMESSPYGTLHVSGKAEDILHQVTRGIQAMMAESIEGPYALVVNPQMWLSMSTYVQGYPLKKHLEEQLGGPVLISSFLDGACLVSTRGGDMRMVVGQDMAIGYYRHDKTTVSLYFTESFTFQVFEPHAIVTYNWTD
ncbi:family 1 encapsulin nanocompartment shell protein [Oceanidesulfovibrio marinus]|uniref:Bacteriocin n=1 Tax=Oceanidesulfovibrio marinus TaxID=370038 RepID=A0A6P1ZMJ8_9BACT|nr:family 1 encapsulin nanocompartment shell protein [Oceanidesulfovibrio marinus]QJT10269.1 bacteriocin [Oceanidesulfovibrio marinus]TVM35655.1 bacteriocin [Oceanidesulfovibrio marinus]